MRRDRLHAHGTAARRAPTWAAGPPGRVGKRSAQQPQGAQASRMEALRGETARLTAQHDSSARPQDGRRPRVSTVKRAVFCDLSFSNPSCSCVRNWTEQLNG